MRVLSSRQPPHTIYGRSEQPMWTSGMGRQRLTCLHIRPMQLYIHPGTARLDLKECAKVGQSQDKAQVCPRTVLRSCPGPSNQPTKVRKTLIGGCNDATQPDSVFTARNHHLYEVSNTVGDRPSPTVAAPVVTRRPTRTVCWVPHRLRQCTGRVCNGAHETGGCGFCGGDGCIAVAKTWLSAHRDWSSRGRQPL